ncbi:hypothetical protein JG687_00016360 [Phytophthora cactorum]|uniref:Uncharacterized protein n=1 Tax=Phytophthora cactorum TaxID=29920 RepID=A0A8T1TSD5_9STRA|nr:hypothetical protein JG687_00016360 [Phytophthora cactorum]
MSEKRGAASEAVRDDGGPPWTVAEHPFAAGKRIHNYMYATLVIEQDDDGDEDFIYDEDFARREEREEEEAEKLPSDLVESPNAARKAGSQRKQSAKRLKNSQDSSKKESTPASLSCKMRHSPHVPSPPPRKKLKEKELVARSRNHQQGVDEEVATTLATSEHVPRKRTSKHLEELESMGNQYDEVVKVFPAFGESRAFESWDDFDKAF